MKPSSSTPNRPSAFGAWFKLQFGRMPNGSRLTKLRNKKNELKAELEATTIEFQMESALHAAWNAALYGWNARKK